MNFSVCPRSRPVLNVGQRSLCVGSSEPYGRRIYSQRRPSIFIPKVFGNTSSKAAVRRDTSLAAKPEQEDDDPVSFPDSVAKNISIFRKFCRPYAIVGTVVCVSSFSTFPLERRTDISLEFLLELLKVLICVVLINIHLIGMNQVCDLEIDKMNKPYLPLASGEMSLTTANAIVLITGSTSIAMALLMRSPPFLCIILTYFFLGAAYSLDYPFLRWKKNAFLSVFCIMAPKGFVIPICMCMHIQKYVLRKPIAFTRSFVFSTTLALIFIFVTATFKDVPDLDGDKAFGMKNFTVLFGKKKIFLFCNYLMMLGYCAAVVKGATLALLPMKLVTMLGHCGLAFILWSRAQSVNLSDNKSTSLFYSFLWKVWVDAKISPLPLWSCA